jgi:hypothetical protein
MAVGGRGGGDFTSNRVAHTACLLFVRACVCRTLPSIPEQGAGAPVAPPPPVRYQSVQFRVKPDPRFVNMQRTRSTVGPDGEVVRVELIGQQARDAFAEASNVSAAAFIQRQVSLPMLKRNATSLLTNKR